MDDKTIELALANIALANKNNVHKQILLAHAKYKYDAMADESRTKPFELKLPGITITKLHKGADKKNEK
jgi:hypothetical protein